MHIIRYLCHHKNGRSKERKILKIFLQIFDIFRPDCILSITGRNSTESYQSASSDILYYKTERRHNLCRTKIRMKSPSFGKTRWIGPATMGPILTMVFTQIHISICTKAKPPVIAKRMHLRQTSRRPYLL